MSFAGNQVRDSPLSVPETCSPPGPVCLGRPSLAMQKAHLPGQTHLPPPRPPSLPLSQISVQVASNPSVPPLTSLSLLFPPKNTLIPSTNPDASLLKIQNLCRTVTSPNLRNHPPSKPAPPLSALSPPLRTGPWRFSSPLGSSQGGPLATVLHLAPPLCPPRHTLPCHVE